MTQPTPRLYPVGIQDFPRIREKNYVYVDKTAYIYRMTHSGAESVFLSRPRRFGKSLLTSTLHAYFEGRKELFRGLAIERMETEWTQYPVLHFDMSMGKHLGKDELNQYLHYILNANEERVGVPHSDAINCNIRLAQLVTNAYALTGKPVVVLIDEYDAPLLDVVHEDEDLKSLRNVMRNFYSPLKALGYCLRFVFLTGITKFSQLSIFSELNNFENISLDKEYAAICGITEEEMRVYMADGLDSLAVTLETTKDAVPGLLKANYDGYHFAWPSPDIYNPYSLLLAFKKGEINSYWFDCGTPTYLIEMMRKFHVSASEVGPRRASADAFDAPTERMTTITPLLYQSGYLTIKDYNPRSQLYTLDIPNKEVRQGLMRTLLPEYINPARKDDARNMVYDLFDALDTDRLDDALRLLQTFLCTVPYTGGTDTEGHYQQLLYVIFSLLGQYVDVEVRTPRGRVDIVLRTTDTLYVMELKLNQSAGSAMRQIDLKNYPERFALSGLPVVKVGISFDGERKTIGEWKIEEA